MSRPSLAVLASSVGVVAVASASCHGAATPSGAVFDTPLLVERFGVAGSPGPYVRLSVPIAATRTDLVYANAAIDANGDQVIAPEEWIVQNVPVPVVPTTYGFSAKIADTTVATADVRVALSHDPVASPWDGTNPPGGVLTTSTVTFEAHDLPAPGQPPVDGLGGGGGPPLGAPSLGLRGDGPANPVEQVLQAGVPSTQQADANDNDDNSCEAHAVGASLAWLARTYGFASKLDYPNADPVADGPGSANRGLLGAQGMVADITATFANGGFYTRVDGVKPSKAINAKQQFVDAKKLPVRTTRIPCDPTAPIIDGVYDGMKQALKAGCAVELVVLLDTDKPTYHMVDVVGFTDTGSAQILFIHDPEYAPETGQPIPDDAIVVDKKATISGFRTPITGEATATLAFALQECPINDADSAANAGAVSCPLGASPISAVFDPTMYTTTYTSSVWDYQGEKVTTTWSGPNCNVWSPKTPSDSTTPNTVATMSWNHAGPPDGNCDHSSPDHTDATVMLTVTNGTTTLRCTYVGAASGDGPPCTAM